MANKSEETTYQRNVAAAAAEPKDLSASNAEDACVVCFKNCDIYSIGECDHPVCFECSTRMRVLCQQNECPICRQVLSKVIFTYDKLPYRELEAKNRSEYYSKKYKICFYTNKIQQAFFDLLDHPCPKCNTPPYRTFAGLKNHVRKDHDLHYCDLCTENLKIFTFERRCYTQAELGLHRTKGDASFADRSHRGHPLCEYCNKRYLDRDELFRHLRREHYFCHFCDADGCNEFYKDYDALAEHFRQDHYLCEEGKCATEQFVGAFRTDIDYKAHVANVHGKSLNKQQAKQTRTLQLEITLGPRGRSGQTEQGIANVSRSRGNDTAAAMREELDEMESMYQNMLQHQQQQSALDGTNEQDFPSLAGVGGGPNLSLTRPPPLSMRNRTGTAGLARTKENFPALGGGGGVFAAAAAVPQRLQQVASAPPQRPQPPAAPISLSSRTKDNFPALGGGSGGGFAPISSMSLRKAAPGSATGAIARTTPHHQSQSSTNGMVIHVSNRPATAAASSSAAQGGNNHGAGKKSSTFDFPALPAGGKSKKHGTVPRTPIDEDMPASTLNLPMTNVSAKHRILVDDYVSVANPQTFQKLQMVQKEESDAKARKAAAAMNAPKLTTLDFPTLSGGGSGGVGGAAVGNNNNNSKAGWVQKAASSAANEKRQRELENRKSKVAPAPLLSKDSKTQATKTPSTAPFNNNNNNSTPQKEPKKSKEKKAAASTEISATANKTNGKMSRERNNNNNENKSSNTNSTSPLQNGNDASSLRPPPGFVNSTKLPPPPPGFLSNVVTVNSVAKSTNNLTFTSSLGESYSIVPSQHAYVQPPEAITRNQKLVGHFKDALKSPEALEEFRHISQKFREGVYKVPAYYEHCQAALRQKFDQIFPELLVLLPDIGKQQALFLVHTQRLNTLSPEQRKSLPKLEVCGTCKQVLLGSDFDSHRKLHSLKENFPTLSSRSGASAKVAARK